MLFTTHTIVGAAVGVATKNPALGFATGFFMHHAMDAMPHFEQSSYRILKPWVPYLGTNDEEVVFDFSKRDYIMLCADFAVGGIALLFLLFSLPIELWVPLMAGVFGCLLPDIIDSSPLWSRKLRAKTRIFFNYHQFHIFFHWTVVKNEAILGLTTQIMLITVSLWYILSYV